MLQRVDGGFQLFHGLLQDAAGAGGVETHVAVQAPAEGIALVQAQLCLVDKAVPKRLVAHAQLPAVQPHQVGGVGAVGLDLGNVFRAEVTDVVKIAGDVFQQLLQP